MILNITEIGDPILREKTTDLNVEEISYYHEMFENMIETLSDAWWVWISAPQISLSKSFFVIRMKPTKNYWDMIDKWPEIIINPKIVSTSISKKMWREWCLSIPWSTPSTWFKWKVPRYERIDVEYMNKEWVPVSRRLEWFEAIVFQHEYDHLQWILFLDQMESLESLCTYEWFQKNKKS